MVNYIKNKLNKNTIINIIGWICLLVPIFFISSFDYQGDNNILQFTYAALPYVLIGIGAICIFSTTEIKNDKNGGEE